MDKKDRMAEITEQLEQGVKDFFTSEKFIRYLDIMSRFHSYSLNNQILIATQKPEATYVAGYNSWIKNFDRHVKRNETGIRILAPQKHQIEIETDRVDESGNAIREKREIISFRPVTVFDVSQTEGKELPELVRELNGDVANYNTMMEAVAVAAPFHINIQEITGEAKGWCDYVSENIVIKAGMSELQTIKTAIHETAHARVHFMDDIKERAAKEVEAEGCAYAVCKHFGLDTSDYSFGYVAAWAQGQPEESLKRSMRTIHEEAGNIIDIIENHFAEKERMLDGVRPKELEDAAKEKVEDVLNELMPFSDAEAVSARFYGSYKLPGEPRVAKVMVEYTGDEREDDVFNAVTENPVSVNGIKLDINPIRPDKSGNTADYYREVKRFERAEMEDDTWPMITVTYSSCKQIVTGRQMSIYEAVSVIDKVDERLSQESLKGNFLRINVSYTYAGRKEEQTDVVILGEGRRNFLDYLNISADVNRYMHRHIQILDTVDAAKSTLSKGSRTAGMYEDMMLEWAEAARRELNYNVEPEISKPPELYSGIKTHENWEMLR